MKVACSPKYLAYEMLAQHGGSLSEKELIRRLRYDTNKVHAQQAIEQLIRSRCVVRTVKVRTSIQENHGANRLKPLAIQTSESVISICGPLRLRSSTGYEFQMLPSGRLNRP